MLKKISLLLIVAQLCSLEAMKPGNASDGGAGSGRGKQSPARSGGRPNRSGGKAPQSPIDAAKQETIDKHKACAQQLKQYDKLSEEEKATLRRDVEEGSKSGIFYSSYFRDLKIELGRKLQEHEQAKGAGSAASAAASATSPKPVAARGLDADLEKEAQREADRKNAEARASKEAADRKEADEKAVKAKELEDARLAKEEADRKKAEAEKAKEDAELRKEEKKKADAKAAKEAAERREKEKKALEDAAIEVVRVAANRYVAENDEEKKKDLRIKTKEAVDLELAKTGRSAQELYVLLVAEQPTDAEKAAFGKLSDAFGLKAADDKKPDDKKVDTDDKAGKKTELQSRWKRLFTVKNAFGAAVAGLLLYLGNKHVVQPYRVKLKQKGKTAFTK